MEYGKLSGQPLSNFGRASAVSDNQNFRLARHNANLAVNVRPLQIFYHLYLSLAGEVNILTAKTRGVSVSKAFFAILTS